MLKKILIFLFTIFAVVPAYAEEEYFPRISAEGQLGINLFLPFGQIRAGYRLPVADNRFEVGVNQSFNVSIGIPVMISGISAKYYFADNQANPSLFTFQPFFSVGAGVSYNLPYNFGGMRNDKITWVSPIFIAGIGTDLHIIKNIQFSGGIYASYPFIFRPELGLKLRF